MKKTSIYIFSSILVIVLTSFSALNTEPVEYSKWLKFHEIEHEDFEEFGAEIKTNSDWRFYDLTSKYIYLFKPFRIINANSTYFADLDSYSLLLERENNQLISVGSEVDIKVQIINLSDTTSNTILFCGTDCYPETAFWLHNNTLQVLGFSLENEKFIPTKWSYNIDKVQLIKYQASKKFDSMPKRYSELIRLKTVDFKY
jgi:hypothetical protein